MKSIFEAKKLAKQISKSEGIQLKEALESVAREEKFPSWKAYKDSLDTFWYRKASPFLNHWFASHGEASEFHREQGGYLLTYKGQFFVVQPEYIEHLGIDPSADIWRRINFDVSGASSMEKVYEYLREQKVPGL